MATWNQSAFRFRNDDGNETTATWKANENVDVNINAGENFRYRIEVENTGGAAEFLSAQLYYSHNGGPYTVCSGASSVIRASASANVADNAATTDQLTTSAKTFTAGTFDEVNCIAGQGADTGDTECTEMEYCLTIVDADVSDGDTIDLRGEVNGGTDFAAYAEIGRITVGPVVVEARYTGVWFR